MPTFLRQIDPEQPVCKNLRTKALYVYGQTTPDMYATSRSSGYQCLRTQFVTGPDAAPCVPESCTPARTCFEPR